MGPAEGTLRHFAPLTPSLLVNKECASEQCQRMLRFLKGKRRVQTKNNYFWQSPLKQNKNRKKGIKKKIKRAKKART